MQTAMERLPLAPGQEWENADDAAQEANLRAGLYRFLGQLFFAELVPESLGALRAWAAEVEPSALRGPFLESLAGEDARVAEELAVGYCATFVRPGGTPLFPHESSQREGAVLGEAACQVESFYRQVQLALPPESSEFPDHVSVEFEFMAQLAGQEAQALAAQDTARVSETRELQRRFLNEHIRIWVPRFATALEKHAAHLFYRTLGTLTHLFVKREVALFEGAD